MSALSRNAWAWLALAAAAAAAGEGLAQALAAPGAAGELRAAYATAAEVAEGGRVARASCAGCHGLEGISRTKGVPHLAGQRPAYLDRELRLYREGGRGEGPMREAVRFLSDDALYKAAAYYASREPARPAAAAAKPAPARPDPLQAGKAAAAPCAGCHGAAGVSSTPGMPSLAGLDPKYLVAAMQAYKSGRRKHEMMKAMLAAPGDAELANVALYYALQKPARAQTPAPGDPRAAEARAAACAGCHGDKGVSANPANPSLAGQDAQYLAAALRAYKEGTRADETMKGLAASLDETAARDLAAYYASQEPQAPRVARPLTAAQWAERCDRCHGVGGNSTDPRIPALASQRAEYLQAVLHAYRTGARSSREMAAMSASLTEDAVEELAAHYARQRARVPVYIILPPK